MSTNIYSESAPTTRKKTKSLVNTALVALSVGTLVGTILSWLVLGAFSASLACGVSIGLACFPLAMYRRDRSPVAPVYLTTLFLLLAYPFKLLAVRLLVIGVSEQFEGRLFNDEAVAVALWMLVAGLTAYYLGYYWTPKVLLKFVSRVRFPLSTAIDSHWYRRALVVCLVGWASFAFQVLAGTWSWFAGLGENWDPRFNQVLAYLFNYVWYGLIAAAIWLSYRNLKRGMTGIMVCVTVILATVTVVTFLMGSKTWLLAPVLYAFLALYMNDRRPPVWLVIPSGAIAVLFAFTFVPMFRSNYAESSTGRAGNVADFYQTGNQTLGQLDQSSVDTSEATANLFNRFAGIDNAVRVMEVVPQQFDYFYFEDFLSLPFSVVPRLLFPSKPSPKAPTFYSIEVAGMTSGGSAAPFPVAEGYINLGWPGVVLLFWIWGIYQSVLFNGFYLPRRHNALVQIIFAFLMVQSVGFGDWTSGVILGLPGQLITMIPFIFIFRPLKLSRPGFGFDHARRAREVLAARPS